MEAIGIKPSTTRALSVPRKDDGKFEISYFPTTVETNRGRKEGREQEDDDMRASQPLRLK